MSSNRLYRKKLSIGFIAGLLLILVDQLTKILAASSMKGNDPIVLIPNILELFYLENQSAAFSFDPVTLFQKIFSIHYFTENPEAFLSCKMGFFVVLTFFVCLAMVYVYQRLPVSDRLDPLRITLVLLVSGAVGNLIDRLRNHYVIDFIYFKIIDFPVFNVADIYVTTATVLLIILILFYYDEKDLSAIDLLHRKQK